MSALRSPLRWSAAALIVLVAVGALVWVLGRDGDPDQAAAAHPTAEATPGPGEQPSSSAPSGTTSATAPAAEGTPPTPTGSAPGPREGRKPGHAFGDGDRTDADRGTGQPTGVPCWGGTGPAPIAPVAVDATTAEIRQQISADLQLLREITPPPAIHDDVEGLRSYYRRVGRTVAAAGGDGTLAPDDRSQVEQLTENVYATFAPPVVDFLSRRC